MAADYRIENVSGNVYRVINDRHRSIFAVTEEGIIATDPMGDAAGEWLKEELEKRFDKPVRFVIYSHNDSDHIYGGQAFEAPGVDFVAHELARQDIVRTKAAAVVPNLTFDDEMTVRLGETNVHLQYHGPNDGRGSINMHFMPANVVFAAEQIA